MYRVSHVHGKGFALYGFEGGVQGFRRLTPFYRNSVKFYERELKPRRLYWRYTIGE